jgi:hypothetical protein
MSIHLNFNRFMCSYDAENDEKLKQLVQTTVFNAFFFKFCVKLVS